MASHPFDAVTLDALRRRRSAKWARFGEDVLPAWVAEMDYPLAEPIRDALARALRDDDTGYAFPADLAEVFGAWAKRTWDWRVAAGDVLVVPDVITGLELLLRVVSKEGDGVVIEPPVYPPFAGTVRATGRAVVPVPLLRDAVGRYAQDLDGIERAYRAGARVHVLCSPHNPAGIVADRDVLVRIGELAERYGVWVLSDEIHAPLVLPGRTHVPFTDACDSARRRGIVLTSASKTWNLAGLKAAMLVASSPEARAVLAALPPETPYHAGHLGVLAARAAFAEGEPWRRDALAILDRNRTLTLALLAEHVPDARMVIPEASYLAWIDFRQVGLGDDPARLFLAKGKVALSPGPTFGAEGAGHARLNFATTRALLEDAMARIGDAVRSHRGDVPRRIDSAP